MQKHYISSTQLAERFMRYARIDTQSDPASHTHPTTARQKDLSQLLLKELRGMGIHLSETDEYGYVYATLPSNSTKTNIQPICFCAHVDTSPDCSGSNVQPILHKNYDGGEIVLPDDNTQVLNTEKFPYLKEQIGEDIITASGLTLLGADDKSGVAIIMAMAEYLQQNPAVKHGEIKIVFTPDEEVGQGTAKIDMSKLPAVGYTLDGGAAGSLEEETFSADSATITVLGISAHPGDAKGKMVNSLKIAGDILHALPKNEWSPETTEGLQGFVHPVNTSGIAEEVNIGFIVRDFKTSRLAEHHARLKKIAEDIVANYPGARLRYQVTEQYRNMKDILVNHPQIVQHAAEAIRRTGLQVKMESIRGGTDGSRLSYMGMPCPNIFTGMQNLHGKLEWISVKDMVLSAETLVHLAQVWEEHA